MSAIIICIVSHNTIGGLKETGSKSGLKVCSIWSEPYPTRYPPFTSVLLCLFYSLKGKRNDTQVVPYEQTTQTNCRVDSRIDRKTSPNLTGHSWMTPTICLHWYSVGTGLRTVREISLNLWTVEGRQSLQCIYIDLQNNSALRITHYELYLCILSTFMPFLCYFYPLKNSFLNIYSRFMLTL